MEHFRTRLTYSLAGIFAIALLSGCSDAYYGLLETFGIHKRDILVERVEETQDTQEDAQQEFQSALEQFAAVIAVENTKLKQVYEKLNSEYNDCLASAKKVNERIDQIESVSSALFLEWENEIAMYQNETLQRRSSQQLIETKERYEEMLSLMYQSVDSMVEILYIFRDNVMYLKHNLNTQAIGALRNEFARLQIEVDELTRQMEVSIASSNTFVEEMQSKSP